ncbi:unnamed protein product [Penicillium salamii]|uniref:Xylose isomerase-like TIM barrel domain-containing protein n=1 Tax=Penicillium salamii TaxID=1612424 RepID=A0A9W4N1E2_9EURO|nr:unnamed protein product [Penicillium salamii]
MMSPLVEGHEFHVDGQSPRINWSRNARLFMYEEAQGGYLPVEEVVRVVVEELGYKGWMSLELFSRSVAEPGVQVPVDHAQRGIRSYRKMCDRLGPVTVLPQKFCIPPQLYGLGLPRISGPRPNPEWAAGPECSAVGTHSPGARKMR